LREDSCSSAEIFVFRPERYAFESGGAQVSAPMTAGRDRSEQGMNDVAPIEHRRAPRRRVLLTGKAQSAALGQAWIVTVRDLSDGGARLRSESGALPPSFVLQVADRELERPCEVVWHKDREFGVCFTDDAPSGPDAPLEARVAALETEILHLRRALARLRDSIPSRTAE